MLKNRRAAIRPPFDFAGSYGDPGERIMDLKITTASTLVLRDQDIRVALERHLLVCRPRPRALIHEVRVQNGRAIADIVAFHKSIHCYEIKGATDSVGRILQQAHYYNASFPKTTLATTSNHLAWAERHAPPFWGLIVFFVKDGRVCMSRRRAARQSPYFSKADAMLSLWRSELESVAQQAGIHGVRKSDTRVELTKKMSVQLSKAQTIDYLRDALLLRNL